MISGNSGKSALLALIMACASCTPDTEALQDTDPLIAFGDIETTATGRCFARTERPTTTRIIDEQVLVVPEVRDASGSVTSPAVYRNISRPEIVTTGEGTRFETLCPPQYTAERIATLQRALKARGAYVGPISASLDPATNAAIRAFQQARGIDSVLISLRNAQELGLVPRSDAELSND